MELQMFHEPSLFMDVHFTKVVVNPSVILTILDAVPRKNPSQPFCIGTLLGVVVDNIVEVNDCFVNCFGLSTDSPSTVTFQSDHIVYHDWMVQMKRKTALNPKEMIVGWIMTTFDELVAGSIRKWAVDEDSKSAKWVPAKTLPEPIFMQVNTSLLEGPLRMRALQRGPIKTIPIFNELSLTIQMPEVDRTTVSSILRCALGKSITGYEPNRAKKMDKPDETVTNGRGIQRSFDDCMHHLLSVLTKAEKYVEDVLEHRRAGDPEVGRDLLRAVETGPLVDVEAFENVCQNVLQDNLMLVYIANLAKLQCAIAEKLNTSSSV